MPIFPKIISTLKRVEQHKKNPSSIPTLQEIGNYVKRQLASSSSLSLNFICTHNSRRSQFGQVWAYAIAHYFGIEGFSSLSAGTEATSIYPSVIDALRNQGFRIEKLDESPNPRYSIEIGYDIEPLVLYSKTIEEIQDESVPFAAVMTCSSADEACPTVAGAQTRFSLNFEDPKHSDETPQELEVYQDKSIEIAAHIYHIFSQQSEHIPISI